MLSCPGVSALGRATSISEEHIAHETIAGLRDSTCSGLPQGRNEALDKASANVMHAEINYILSLLALTVKLRDVVEAAVVSFGKFSGCGFAGK